MKNIGFVSFHSEFNKNNDFLDPSKCFLGNNMEYGWVLLKQLLNENGMDINTLDICPLEKCEAILFSNFPSAKNFPAGVTVEKLYISGKKLFLILFEPESIRPENFYKENHVYFEKIFTWNDDWVDNKKYFKLNIGNKYPKQFIIDLSRKQKLCTMIVSRKRNPRDPRQLYDERIKAIRWFEHHHADDFDLYGMYWNIATANNIIKLFIKKLLIFISKAALSLGPYYFKSHKGQVGSKYDVLSRYKFAICYENTKDIPGYITEKIFDCFFAMTVPVYWGAPNVTDYIPKSTFIDKRDFKTYEGLYKFLKGMSDGEYIKYLENILVFLRSEKADQFKAENYAKTLFKHLSEAFYR